MEKFLQTNPKMKGKIVLLQIAVPSRGEVRPATRSSNPNPNPDPSPSPNPNPNPDPDPVP